MSGCTSPGQGFPAVAPTLLPRRPQLSATLSVLIRARSEHPVVRRGWRESGSPAGRAGRGHPPPWLSPSPGDGDWVKSLDFNGGIGLKSLNSARPHCGGVGGGERSAGGMGGLPALLWERGETSGVPASCARAPRAPAHSGVSKAGAGPSPPGIPGCAGNGAAGDGASRP